MNSIPESAKMEEGGFVDEAVPSTGSSTTSTSSTAKARSRLSTVSRKYDIDGDGELDDAELAMRRMDVSGRGYLTNDKVYKLMEESLRLQKDVFKMKKVIVGLLVFVVILALSNLGTSFASAILAKDTTTNDNNELVNKKTGEAVATDQAIERYESEELTNESSRRLVRYGVSSGSFTSMSTENALNLLKKCKRGKIVKLTYLWADGELAERTVCGNDWTCAVPSDFKPSRRPTTGRLCVQGTDEYVYINPDPDDSDSYIISATNMDVLTADLSETCEDDEDCDDGLSCLKEEQGDSVGSCSAARFCTKDAKICSDGTTLSRVGPNCEFPECPETTTSTSTTSTTTSTTIATKPPTTTSTSTTSTTTSTSTTSTTSTTTESEVEETTTEVPEVGGPVGGIPVPRTDCETNQDCIDSEMTGWELCASNGVCSECEIGATRVHDTRPVCIDQSGGVGIWACNVSEECTVAGTTCSSPSCAAFNNGNYCSSNHDEDAGCFTTGGTGGGQQAPEELADECNSTNNLDDGTNQDCINLYQSSRDYCDPKANVCGQCVIGTTGNDAERPLCVDQGNGVAVWGCDDSSCASGTACGSPSCVPGIPNYCNADHDSHYGCGTTGGQQAPEELATCTSNDECAANGDGKDFCNREVQTYTLGVCGECEIGTARFDNQRPLCIDQGNGIAVWGCDDSSCTVEGTSCGSPSCAADIPYYCSDNHEAECN